VQVVLGILVGEFGNDIDGTRYHGRVGILQTGLERLVKGESQCLRVLDKQFEEAKNGLFA